MASESEIIKALSAIFKASNSGMVVGIGDDGAVAPASNKQIVMSSDMAVEGIHFKRNWSSLKEIGAKITAANLADIYAMGGVPKYLLVSAGLPDNFTIPEVTELATGIKSEADLVNCVVVGGDISKEPEHPRAIDRLERHAERHADPTRQQPHQKGTRQVHARGRAQRRRAHRAGDRGPARRQPEPAAGR